MGNGVWYLVRKEYGGKERCQNGVQRMEAEKHDSPTSLLGTWLVSGKKIIVAHLTFMIWLNDAQEEAYALFWLNDDSIDLLNIYIHYIIV